MRLVDVDDAGNQTLRTKTATGETAEYAWDHRNRLTGVTFKDAVGVVTQDVEYVYDPQDRRIVKRLDADGNGVFEREERFVFDQGVKGGLDDAVLVFDQTGARTHRLLHGPAVDQPLADERPSAGTLWYLVDPLGTVREVVRLDSGTGVTSLLNRVRYDSFGKIVNQTNAAYVPRYGFTARDLDTAVELWWYRARWYDAAAGRFLSEDLEAFENWETNRYFYVRNTPTQMTDPSGQVAWEPVIVVGATICCGGCVGYLIAASAAAFGPCNAAGGGFGAVNQCIKDAVIKGYCNANIVSRIALAAACSGCAGVAAATIVTTCVAQIGAGNPAAPAVCGTVATMVLSIDWDNPC